MAAWGYEFLSSRAESILVYFSVRELLSAREDKIRIPKRSCNVLFML